jgi:hypothetical protein
MTYTWAEFKAAVLSFLTDRTPTDALFAVAASEYVRARIALNLQNDRDTYALLERKYTQLRKSLCGYETTASDATLRTSVKALLRDTSADNTLFAEAVTNFVRAQIDKDSGKGAAYAALRLKLAGFATTLNDAQLQAAVRANLSDGPRTNAAVAQAVALYVRAELAREVDARDQNAIQAAQAIAASCRQDYERMRLRLAGFNHTLAGGLAAEVQKYQPIEKNRANIATMTTALIANAVEDLQAFGTWLDAQIATAKDDLQGYGTWLDAQTDNAKRDIQAMNDRVAKEIRSGAIDLQRIVRAFQLGQTDILQEGDTEAEGFASLGVLDDQQLRAASILINRSASPDIAAVQDTVTPDVGVVTSLADEQPVYSLTVLPHPDNVSPVLIGYDTNDPVSEAPLGLPSLRGKVYDLAKVVIKTQTAGDKVAYFAVVAPADDDNRELVCAAVAWADRREKMVNTDSCAAQIALSPKGDAFLVTPQLVGDQIALRLEWDGMKLDFDDEDDTAFDELAAEAVGLYVNSKLALEWGEAGAQVQAHYALYLDKRTALYLRHRARGEVRA